MMIKDRMVVEAREDVGRPTRGIRLRSRRPRPATARRRWTRIDGGGLDQAVGRAEITTVQWFGQWLEQRARDGALGPRTAENYQAILRCHIEPTIGSVPLTDLSRDDVSALKGQLTSGLAPATVHKILGLLKKGLDAAVSAGVIESSPASAVSSPTVTGRMRERRALNETEIGALLRASSGTSLDVAIRFALATGIRQSELLGARWEALDLERGVFVVERSLHHVAGEFVLRTPKTRNSHRAIELSERTVAMMRALRIRQLAEHPSDSARSLVFPNARGGFQHRRTFLTEFRRILRQSGIEDEQTVNFHSLRHTAASIWIKAGVDLLIVSRRLGHSSASFTMDVYGHLLPGQQRAAAEAMDHLMV